MVRSEALKEAQKRYRAKQDKYEIVKKINTKSNTKRYKEDAEFREKQKVRQREYYLKKKELKLKANEVIEPEGEEEKKED
tara:strand:+ start:1623 stop:1862 length:240 start_codon:yes stop_codon:yes gene_type:complete